MNYDDDILNSLFNGNDDLIIFLNLAGNIITTDNNFSFILGCKNAEYIDKHYRMFVTDNTKQNFDENFSRSINGEKRIAEIAFKGSDGEIFEGMAKFYPAMSRKEVIGVYVIIEEFNKKEKDLYNIRRLFRIMANNSKDLIIISDAGGKYLFVSPSSVKILGYKPEELIGTYRQNYICQKDHRKIQLSLETDDPDKINTYKYRFKHKDKGIIWLESTITVINDRETASKKFLSISRDITERMEMEEMLKESERRHRLLVEESPNSVIIYQQGKWVYVNQTGVKLLGARDKDEIIGKNPYDFIHPDYHKLFKKQKVDVQRGNTVNFVEEKWIRLDGEVIDVEIKANPIIFDGKSAIHIVITDISEQKKIYELAQKTEKIFLVGQLAAGMAHEIRNPLTSIKGFLQLLKNEIANKKYLDIMLTEINQIELITSELLVLARSNIAPFSQIVLQPLLNQVITLLNTQAILHDVEIIKDLTTDPIIIKGDINQIKQLFINIIKNAIEAMPNGGKITIELKKEVENAIIRIIDNGSGMSPEDIKRIGEPFYTTKEKGTGLGMMISYKIIEDHNGSIHVDSKLNEGTTFEIKIPLCK